MDVGKTDVMQQGSLAAAVTVSWNSPDSAISCELNRGSRLARTLQCRLKFIQLQQ